MKPETQKLPSKASEYIQDYFREEFLFEVKEVRQINGHLHYFVEVSKDESVHLLHFDEQGNLLVGRPSDSFEANLHEDPPFDEIQE